jgi:uncharacterized protein (TIGR03435 family)
MIRAFNIAALGVFGCGAAFGKAAASAPAAAATAAPGAASAGAPTGSPTFEVASVKRNTVAGDSEPTGDSSNGRLSLRNMPMFVLVARAYGVNYDRLAGPDWIRTERYDIDAKFPPDSKSDALWPMLQNLLAERFKLVVHRDQTLAPVYALVVAKGGPKFQAASAGSETMNKCSGKDQQLTCLNRKSTMADLVRNLPRWMSRDWFDLPIVDQTGLEGTYDFTLAWTSTRRADDTSGASDPGFVSVFDALQDQLGLKLERRKAPLDRIVIDHIERIPTEN